VNRDGSVGFLFRNDLNKLLNELMVVYKKYEMLKGGGEGICSGLTSFKNRVVENLALTLV
jgi:hypothetical protein